MNLPPLIGTGLEDANARCHNCKPTESGTTRLRPLPAVDRHRRALQYAPAPDFEASPRRVAIVQPVEPVRPKQQRPKVKTLFEE
jgi:hypothetical protein